MKTFIVLVCLFAVAIAQQRQEPERPRPPLDPRNNTQSSCGRLNRTCGVDGICISRRMDNEHTISECLPRVQRNGSCMQRNIVPQGCDRDTVTNDNEVDKSERIFRERGNGARDRDTAGTINGAIEQDTLCTTGSRCISDVCEAQTTICTTQNRNQSFRCDDEGMFRPLQCRRINGTRAQPATALCYCVHPLNGSIIRNTMRRVGGKDDVPDCETRSFQMCTTMRGNRRIVIRHGESFLTRANGECMKCKCNNGRRNCTNLGPNVNCSRFDPNVMPRNCTMDGKMVMHGEQREDGGCNRCGCRNGKLLCTKIRECTMNRDNDQDNDNDQENGREMQCDSCMKMRNAPVCAFRDGRTFPTRCHATNCQDISENHIENGTCSSKNSCERQGEMCGANSNCMQRGGRTQMSRDDCPESRRLCVNRMELRCAPTITQPDGSRKIMKIKDSVDPLEELDEDEDNRTVCATDGNSYPSTCHMITESRGDTIPRVRHPGRCNERPQGQNTQMVCGSDRVTYDDEDTMQTLGGNVRMDYRGPCIRPELDTPDKTCEMVRMNRRCPNMTNCTRRVQPADGCCPACGSIVMMAIDQDAMDDHVRETGELRDVDKFMGSMFKNRDNNPIIPENATKRCNISMTRPTTIRGNMTEVLFKARNMTRDAMHCHEQAMMMMRRINDMDGLVSIEQSFIAAAAIAPQVDEPTTAGATGFTASCLSILLLAMLMNI